MDTKLPVWAKENSCVVKECKSNPTFRKLVVSAKKEAVKRQLRRAAEKKWMTWK